MANVVAGLIALAVVFLLWVAFDVRPPKRPNGRAGEQ